LGTYFSDSRIFWSPIGMIDARFFLYLELQVANRLYWCPVFPGTKFFGHQSASLVPCFFGNWIFWSPNGSIGALFFRKLDFVVTKRLHWCPVFPETGFCGHQSASLVPCFSGNWILWSPIGSIGALFFWKLGFLVTNLHPWYPFFFSY
jgi:hypothetical protein